MHLTLRIVAIMGAAVLISIAAPVFAESAPVFDADAMQQQFDGDVDQNQDLPPSSSASNRDETFVPVQQSSASPTVAAVQSTNVEQRLQRLEQQIDNLQGNESTVRIDSLQNQVQALRGQIEELTHQLQQMQTQQKTMYTDLDNRLTQQAAKPSKKIVPGVTEANSDTANQSDTNTKASANKSNAKIAAAKASKTTVGADTSADPNKKSLDGQPNVAEEQQIYQAAYNLIKAKKYNEAVDVLQGMLKKYPSGQFASNAHYWLGELYGLMGKNDLALNEFDTVVSTYPDSPRVSDAQLKVGLIYSAQSKWSDAKASFRKVINRYPGTASARVASEQLKQIKTSGH